MRSHSSHLKEQQSSDPVHWKTEQDRKVCLESALVSKRTIFLSNKKSEPLNTAISFIINILAN